jgi:hypothetical protein
MRALGFFIVRVRGSIQLDSLSPCRGGPRLVRTPCCDDSL